MRRKTDVRRHITAGEARTKDPVLSEAVRRLVEALQPERIYLFGSRARKGARIDSDYDLLVVVRQRVGPGRELERRANAALWGIGAPIDVVILTSEYYAWMLGAAASLPATVEREGRLLYAA
ncbi:MAG: nucleotidyltransferase domain-containing protein [Chloroflexota bacterium]